MPKILMGAQMLALSRPNNTQSQYGFPTKLGEYLATGKPVVVTKVGEIPLFLHDGENAFMANPDDVNDFANKLIEVARDYPVALKVAQKGKELAYTEFSSKVQSEMLLDFIRRTI
jgi:glycosyltransferase involved in cell wall biosynthesis